MREQLYACEPNFLLGYLDRVENASADEIRLAAAAFAGDEDSDPLDDILDDDGETARIRVEGPLSMSGPSPLARLFGLQGTSYRAIAAACTEASASPCRSVVFAFNSPGGEVAGVDQCWQAMRALAAQKPCTAENTGMMASAAYWLASACPRIVATSPSCEQGSIGVKVVAIDDSGMGDKVGLKRVTIVSKNAPNKVDDVSQKAARAAIQDRCDAMERQFIARVAEGRGLATAYVAESFGRGGLLIAKDTEPSDEKPDALRVRMIDAVVAPPGMPVAPNQVAMTPSVPDTGSRRPSGIPAMPGAIAATSETSGYVVLPDITESPVITTITTTSGTFLPAAVSAPTPVVPNPEPRRVPMTLIELLQANPGAKAEYDAALKGAHDSGRAEMQAVADKVGKYLTSDVYSKSKPIVERALSAIAGKASVETVEAAVSMFDLMAEQRRQDQAAAETVAAGETAPQKLESDAAVMAKAAALKIDVAALTARAVAAKMDPAAALAAEIQNQETLASDRARMGA